ncbi:unnamed protein product [Cylicocyclus nassatus]|uniref:Uncharacterized protein n=1 Tax=Cylicocyclus nassatus TaxID=53992 RepID=A0AA36MFY5_CYLNA|nr:unnamed protein product [Cylicocyclus nassatus]
MLTTLSNTAQIGGYLEIKGVALHITRSKLSRSKIDNDDLSSISVETLHPFVKPYITASEFNRILLICHIYFELHLYICYLRNKYLAVAIWDGIIRDWLRWLDRFL